MLEIKDGKFYINGEEENIYSGAMHYFRIMPEYWEDRLLKLKAAGLNTVETYVPWNKHEPKENEYDFSEILDIEKFIETAEKSGLYVIVRPGPYICAEWDFGGFPAWLLKDENIRLRCYDKKYISYVERYFRVLIPKLIPHLASNGGNIIAMQVENEYGSYGRDKKYMAWIRSLMRELGVDIQLFTSDGETRSFFSGGGLKEDFMVANFGTYNEHRFDDLKILQPDKPLMCGEHWCGWFEQWGNEHYIPNPEELKLSLEGFFRENASFNLYMFHGGTNFGYTAGANYYERYYPTVTSYDYGAPLTENGAYTEKYHILREMMHKHTGKMPMELPKASVTQNIGKVELTEYAPLMKNLKKVSTRKKSHLACYMEHYGQTSGLILYSTTVEGSYTDTELKAYGVHDLAWIYINGKLIHTYDRRKLKGEELYNESFSVPVKAFDGKIKIDILVQALGRVNYGRRIYDRKGLKEIYLANQELTDFDIYNMEFDKAPDLTYKKGKTDTYPCILKGTFKADEKTDCFIDLTGFTNCTVYINGFNLGRMMKEGPQKTLYLPGVLLKSENEVIILELSSCKKQTVKLIDKPLYK